jgi:exosortase
VVILAGVREFGRSLVGLRYPRALWPLVDRPVLEHQLLQLARQGFRNVVICANGEAEALERWISGQPMSGLALSLVRDERPRGAAGCVKDAVGKAVRGPVLIVEAGSAWVANGGELVRQHRLRGADLTVFTDADEGTDGPEVRPAGVYLCEAAALELVPDHGYQDIKEQLIPALLRRGRRVAAGALAGQVFSTRDLDGYLLLLSRVLAEPEEFGLDLSRHRLRGEGVWVAEDARVSSSARLFGPVVVLEGVTIEPEAAVVGPAAVGRGCSIGRGALVSDSVLWDECVLDCESGVVHTVVTWGARIGRGAHVENRVVVRRAGPWNALVRGLTVEKVGGGALGGHVKRRAGRRAASRAQNEAGISADAARGLPSPERPAASEGARVAGGTGPAAYVLPGAAILVAMAWAYRSVLADLWDVWMRNDNYSSGVLVPFLAGYVVLSRRRELARLNPAPSWWGLAIIIVGFLFRLAGSFLVFGSAERLSLFVVVAGLVLFLFGGKVTRRLGWVLAFLLLMFPLPNRVYEAISLPLQTFATRSTAFVLELLGYLVVRQGNVLNVENTSVAVAEACSGLRMLTAFVVVAGLVALLSHRPRWQKAVILLSSVAVAILCNILRLTALAIAFTRGWGAWAEQGFHDFGGVAMMPLALAALAGELWVMDQLFVAGRPTGSPVGEKN